MKHVPAVIAPLFLLLSFLAPLNTLAARSLSFGLSGNDVKTLQNTLIAEGYLAVGKATGYFGPLTETAIKKFQCDQNIICSGARISGYGIYGPRTQAALAGVSAASQFEFSGWIPYWRTSTGTADVLPHLSQLTSVMPFGYTMKNDGTLADTAKLTEEPWISFIATAKKANVRVIPTVMWGNGETIHRILSNTATRIALEDEIANTVKQNNFDGIDIDFEAKKHETIDHFSTFLKGLDMRLGNKWLYCTVETRMPLNHRYSPGAVIPPDATDYANDYTQMNKYCDRVEIMAYDQGTIDVHLNGIRPMPYAPVADPEWVESLVMLAAKSISKNKLVIGIPTYGYEYQVSILPGSSFEYKVLWPFNPQYAIDIAAQFSITPTRTGAGELSIITTSATPAPAGSESTETQQAAPSTITQSPASLLNAILTFNYLTWSDAKAIADKVALARKLGVRGVAVFKFDGGQDPAMWNVLK
ncbi:MAG: polysaccharide deacetylase [Parcubacteria group bacterium Gr01-1014_70]|nr:MAG: polysaccharide deacetylase [Parcubacteria group bacterium Gr01-1014_70]